MAARAGYDQHHAARQREVRFPFRGPGPQQARAGREHRRAPSAPRDQPRKSTDLRPRDSSSVMNAAPANPPKLYNA